MSSEATSSSSNFSLFKASQSEKANREREREREREIEKEGKLCEMNGERESKILMQYKQYLKIK